jgi:hypothetical protein
MGQKQLGSGKKDPPGGPSEMVLVRVAGAFVLVTGAGVQLGLRVAGGHQSEAIHSIFMSDEDRRSGKHFNRE